MVHFNGETRHEWPEFVKELFAMGADEGGWEQALDMHWSGNQQEVEQDGLVPPYHNVGRKCTG